MITELRTRIGETRKEKEMRRTATPPFITVAAMAAALATSILIVVSIATSSEPAQAAFPGTNGKIAFVSARDGNFEVYTMNTDGASQVNLTRSSALDFSPDYSADGQNIVFQSTRDGNSEIYRMTRTGPLQTRLTINTAIDGAAAWSPDGTQIAFSSDRDGDDEIYTMRANGTRVRMLCCDDEPQQGLVGFSDTTPVWSPDGTKIAWTRGSIVGADELVPDIYTMNAGGTGVRRLTNDPAIDARPDWSPNGNKITFWSDRDGNSEIYTINADGTGVQRLTNNSARDEDPVYSPDGKNIAFQSTRDGGNNEIYRMTSTGTSQTRLTFNAAEDVRPSWQPLP